VIDEQEVVRLYAVEMWTLRRIARLFDTNHHIVERVLNRNSVFKDDKGRKQGPRKKPKPRTTPRKKSRWKIVHTEANNRKNMKRKLKTDLDLSVYEDFGKLRFLTRVLSRQRKHMGFEDATRKAFLDKFYFCPKFNWVYDRWLKGQKNKWLMPTLDHKIPRSRKGDWSLENLQFLTWFENRAKADMTAEEWAEFRIRYNVTSTLFI